MFLTQGLQRKCWEKELGLGASLMYILEIYIMLHRVQHTQGLFLVCVNFWEKWLFIIVLELLLKLSHKGEQSPSEVGTFPNTKDIWTLPFSAGINFYSEVPFMTTLMDRLTCHEMVWHVHQLWLCDTPNWFSV